MASRIRLAGVLAVVLLLGAGSVEAATGDKPAKRRPDRILSNERTFTRWAYVADAQPVYAAPRPGSKPIARLHWWTEDGFPEVYLLLRAHWDRRGVEWIKLRIPGRPNGRVGWARREALGAFHQTHWLLVVNRERLRVGAYLWGHFVWDAPIGVGKPTTPTPAGRFWIRERFKLTDPASGYYPYAFGTADYSTLTEWPRGGVVGIHGPFYAAGLIPGHISHGCIRLRVPDDSRLARYAHVGVPVHVI